MLIAEQSVDARWIKPANLDVYSVQLVKLTGASFESTVYRPVLLYNLSALRFSISPKINVPYLVFRYQKDKIA